MNSMPEEVLFRSSVCVLEPLSSSSATRAANFVTIAVIRNGSHYTTRVSEANGNIFGVHAGIPDSLGLSGKQFLLKLKLQSSGLTESYTVHILNDGEASNLIQIIVALARIQLPQNYSYQSPVIPALVQQQQLLNSQYGNPNPLNAPRQQQLSYSYQYSGSNQGPSPSSVLQRQMTQGPISTPANVFASFLPAATGAQQVHNANQNRVTQQQAGLPPIPSRVKTPPRPPLPPPIIGSSHSSGSFNFHPKRRIDQERPVNFGSSNEGPGPSASKQVRTTEQPRSETAPRHVYITCPYCRIPAVFDTGRYILHLNSEHREQAIRDRKLFHCGSCPRMYLTPIDQLLHCRIMHKSFKCLYCDYNEDYYREKCRDDESKLREYPVLKTHILKVHHEELDRQNEAFLRDQPKRFQSNDEWSAGPKPTSHQTAVSKPKPWTPGHQNHHASNNPNYRATKDTNARSYHNRSEGQNPSNRLCTVSNAVNNHSQLNRDKGPNRQTQDHLPKPKAVDAQSLTDRRRPSNHLSSSPRPVISVSEKEKRLNDQATNPSSAVVATTNETPKSPLRPLEVQKRKEIREKSSSPEIIAVTSSTDVSANRQKGLNHKKLSSRVVIEKKSQLPESRTNRSKSPEKSAVDVRAERPTTDSSNVSVKAKARAREPTPKPKKSVRFALSDSELDDHSSSPEIVAVSSTTQASQFGKRKGSLDSNNGGSSIRSCMSSTSPVQPQSSSNKGQATGYREKHKDRNAKRHAHSNSDGEPESRTGSGTESDCSIDLDRDRDSQSDCSSDSEPRGTDTDSDSPIGSGRYSDSSSNPQSSAESEPERHSSSSPEVVPVTPVYDDDTSPVRSSKKKKKRRRIRILSPSPDRSLSPTNRHPIQKRVSQDFTRVSKGPIFGSIKCQCGTWEACYTDLILHVQKKHPKRIVACDQQGCKLRFLTSDELKVHQASEHSEEKICPFCPLPLAISTRTQLSKHIMNVHEQTKSFVIPLDFLIFGFGHHTEYLQRISKPMTNTKEHSTCKDCDSSFSSPLHLKLHQKFRLGSDCSNCTKCDSVFQAKICRKSVNWWIDWANHFESHPNSKEKIHRCHCGVVSLTELEMKIHKTLHRDDLTHCCIEGCDWEFNPTYYVDKFARRLALTEHFQQCHQESLTQGMVQPPSILLQSYTLTRADNIADPYNADRWHKCSFCPKRFQLRLYMELHEKISHEGHAKNRPCKECEPVFKYLGVPPLKSWQSWLHHLKIHEDKCRKQLCLRCNTCELPFLTEDELLVHSIVHCYVGEYHCPCCDDWSMAEINWETFTSHILDTHEQELQMVLPLRLILGLEHHNSTIEKQHKPPDTAPCSDCKLRMPVDKKEVVKMHMDYAHTRSAHLCLHCGEHYVTRNKLMSHLRKCKKLAKSQDTSFCLHQCYACNETFLTETYRDRHCFLAHHQIRCFICYERIKSSPNASRHVVEAQYAKHLLEDHWKAPLIPLPEKLIKTDQIEVEPEPDVINAHEELNQSMIIDDQANVNAEPVPMVSGSSTPGSPEPFVVKPALIKTMPTPIPLMTLDDISSAEEEPLSTGTAMVETKPNVQTLTVMEYEDTPVASDMKPNVVFLKPKPAVPSNDTNPPAEKIEVVEYESAPKAEPCDNDSDETILNASQTQRIVDYSDSDDTIVDTSRSRRRTAEDSDSDSTVINSRNPPLPARDDSDSDDTVINPRRERRTPRKRIDSDSDDETVANANQTEDIEEIDTHDPRIPVILNEYNLPEGYENLHLHSSKFGPFICYLCRGVCETYNGMRRHWAKKHNLENATNCSACKLPLPSEEVCEAHEYNVHYYKCSKCDKRFDEESLLRKHEVSKHQSLRKYRCNIRSCLGKYISKSALARHFTKRHPGGMLPTGEFECHVCFKTDLTKDELKDHVKTHEGSLTLFCPTCDDWWISGPGPLVQDFFIFHFIYLHGSEYIREKLKESFNR